MRARALVVLAFAGSALTLSACAPTVTEASDAYCSTLDTLEAEIGALENLVNRDVTVDEARDQADAVKDAYEDTRSAAEDLNDAIGEASDEAFATFDETVSSIPDDLKVSETLSLYTQATSAYLTELAAIRAEANCT